MDNKMDSEPPAARVPGAAGSARLGLLLFSLNILLVAVLIGSYINPSSRRQPAPPGATPTTAAFDVGALPVASPTNAPIHSQATATATPRPRAAPTATRALPTATPTPPPIVGVTPTPDPTVSNSGG